MTLDTLKAKVTGSRLELDAARLAHTEAVAKLTHAANSGFVLNELANESTRAAGLLAEAEDRLSQAEKALSAATKTEADRQAETLEARRKEAEKATRAAEKKLLGASSDLIAAARLHAEEFGKLDTITGHLKRLTGKDSGILINPTRRIIEDLIPNLPLE